MVAHWCWCIVAVGLFLPSAATAQSKVEPATPRGNPGDWFPQNSYPPEAKRKGEQGRVGVRLDIDKTGRPIACVVVESSGSDSLDAATCELALANGRFRPALGARGQPVAATYKLPGVRWELADNRVMDLTSGAAVLTLSTVQIDVDEQGRGISCRPLDSLTGDIGCQNFVPGTQVSPALMRKGKPVAGKVTMTLTMRVDPQ